VKIVHTADLHLSEQAEERWEALKEVVHLTAREKAGLLVITGDLFDRHLDADRMRPRLREILGGTCFQTVILPGNHDYKAYRDGLHFGDKVRVFSGTEQPLRVGTAALWGLPYEKIAGERLVARLSELGAKMNPDDNNILLYHGELLDAFFSRRELGDEGDQRYMPVRLSYFDLMPLKFILAGHFHSRYAAWPLAGGGKFIYSGSPVAVTRREVGRRAVNLLDLAGEAKEILLNSFHYEELAIELDPATKENPLDYIELKLRQTHEAAKVMLKVSGYFNGAAIGLNESELARGIRNLAGARLACEPFEEYADVRLVLEDELFKKFSAKLELAACAPEEKQRAFEMVLEAFREVKLCS
jgi:DNA repair protein SbcD/Mre11